MTFRVQDEVRATMQASGAALHVRRMIADRVASHYNIENHYSMLLLYTIVALLFNTRHIILRHANRQQRSNEQE
jgi:hypothetical protein